LLYVAARGSTGLAVVIASSDVPKAKTELMPRILDVSSL
jgi:hypothetical protein